MAYSILRFLVVLPAAVLIIGSRLVAQENATPPRIVTRNCSGCHGLDGNAQLSYFPRLAGLNAPYTAKKIVEFRTMKAPSSDEVFSWLIAPAKFKHGPNTKEARTNMIGIAHEITAEEVEASSGWYASQLPAGGRPGNLALIDEGRGIFLKGLPSQGVLACQTCHGANAQGIAGTPRLAGQNSSYLMNQLEKFKRGDRTHAPVMTMVAQKGESQQFHALAAYLQSL